MKALLLLGAVGIGGYFLIKNMRSQPDDYDMRTANDIKQNRIAALTQPLSTVTSSNIPQPSKNPPLATPMPQSQPKGKPTIPRRSSYVPISGYTQLPYISGRNYNRNVRQL